MSAVKLTHPFHWLAFGLGSGMSPKAPGTAGTVAALPIWWLFLDGMPLLPYIGVLIAGLAFGVVICERTSEYLGVHDHGGIVWDEWIGMWLTLLLVPEGWLWVVYAFVLFRIFDILKPWPINWLDKRVKGGFGIMIDDVLAGVMAWIVLQLTAGLMG